MLRTAHVEDKGKAISILRPNEIKGPGQGHPAIEWWSKNQNSYPNSELPLLPLQKAPEASPGGGPGCLPAASPVGTSPPNSADRPFNGAVSVRVCARPLNGGDQGRRGRRGMAFHVSFQELKVNKCCSCQSVRHVNCGTVPQKKGKQDTFLPSLRHRSCCSLEG